jgi:hypothetical protein
MSSPPDPGPDPHSAHRVWLHRELESWTKDGIISPETADRLRLRHPLDPGQHAQAPQRSAVWIMVIFGIIGAVLVGGGIILLLAHNWEQMGRPARIVVAFTPLVLSQWLAFWMLWTDRGGLWGREAVGTFVALMAGACIALISQTYHLGGDFAQFMLVWTLLSLPVAYLLRATLPAIWYCSAAAIWVCNIGWWNKGEALWFWPLLALVIPYWWMEVRRNRYGPRAVLLAWALAGAGSLGVAVCCERNWDSGTSFLAVSGWYVFLFLAGRRWFNEGRSIWRRPLQFIGVIGATIIALILTFKGAGVSSMSYHDTGQPFHSLAWIAACGWVVPAVALWIMSFARRDAAAMVVGVLPVLVEIGIASQAGGGMQALFNMYVFAAGLALLVAGVRAQRIGTVNGGMAIIAALVMCRFFDTDMSFILRGVVFIILGVAFIVTNFVLLRKKAASAA